MWIKYPVGEAARVIKADRKEYIKFRKIDIRTDYPYAIEVDSCIGLNRRRGVAGC
jgi:hypothetical protein